MKKHFAKISANGVPAAGIAVSVALMLIAPIMSFSSTAIEVFGTVAGATSDMYILVYVLALLAHRKYRESSDFMEGGFKMPFYKVSSPLTIAFFLVIFFIPADVFGASLAASWTLLFGGWCWLSEKHRSAHPRLSN